MQISSVYHQAPNEFDVRSFVPPRIYTAADRAATGTGIDPAMVAILAPNTTAPVIEIIECGARGWGFSERSAR